MNSSPTGVPSLLITRPWIPFKEKPGLAHALKVRLWSKELAIAGSICAQVLWILFKPKKLNAGNAVSQA